MSRTLRFAALVLLAAPVLGAQCGSNPIALLNPARLEITSRLRAACPYPDQNIAAVIEITETARISNVSYAESRAVEIASCTTLDDPQANSNSCILCIAEIVDQVYGF